MHKAGLKTQPWRAQCSVLREDDRKSRQSPVGTRCIETHNQTLHPNMNRFSHLTAAHARTIASAQHGRAP